jgi:hypothetical protein
MTEIKTVKERGLIDEIEALKEFNVPEPVIHRIIDKVMRCAENEKMRYRDKDEEITKLKLQYSNLLAVLNATGYYLSLHESIIRED